MSDPDTESQAWIALPDPDVVAASRPPDHPYNFGFATGMGRLLAAHPQIGPAFMQLFSAIMFAPEHLERQEREMVAAVTSAAQECLY